MSGFLCFPSCHKTAVAPLPAPLTYGDVENWRNGLRETLAHQRGRDMFAQFCNEEKCEDNLLAYERIGKYKMLKKQGDREREAIRIYEKYFCTSSGNEVSVSGKLMEPLRAALQSKITGDIFDDVQNELFDLMARDPFQRFLSHQMYTDLLESLVVHNQPE